MRPQTPSREALPSSPIRSPLSRPAEAVVGQFAADHTGRTADYRANARCGPWLAILKFTHYPQSRTLLPRRCWWPGATGELAGEPVVALVNLFLRLTMPGVVRE